MVEKKKQGGSRDKRRRRQVGGNINRRVSCDEDAREGEQTRNSRGSVEYNEFISFVIYFYLLLFYFDPYVIL